MTTRQHHLRSSKKLDPLAVKPDTITFYVPPLCERFVRLSHAMPLCNCIDVVILGDSAR
jgi:hypothetical protein